MMGSAGMHSGMGCAWLFWILLILGIVAVAVVLVKLLSGGRSGHHHPGEGQRPRDILDERYARGELTTDAYRERLQNLDQGPK